MTETHSQKRLIGFALVSTYGRTLDSQLEQLRAARCSSRNICREKVTGARADRRELRREPLRRSTKAPRRRDQRGSRLFKVGRAFLRAERVDARSVKQPVRFRAQCIGRRSDAALCRGLRARPPPDPKQPATDTSKLEKN